MRLVINDIVEFNVIFVNLGIRKFIDKWVYFGVIGEVVEIGNYFWIVCRMVKEEGK